MCNFVNFSFGLFLCISMFSAFWGLYFVSIYGILVIDFMH